MRYVASDAAGHAYIVEGSLLPHQVLWVREAWPKYYHYRSVSTRRLFYRIT